MDALTEQLAALPLATLEAMARATLAPGPRLLTALRVATARETANANASRFPGLAWVTL